MTAMPNDFNNTLHDEHTDKETVVTLALLKQIVSQTNEMAANHQAILTGNGHPETGICWAIQNLSLSIKKLQESIEKIDMSSKQALEASMRLQQEMNSLKNNDANLSWSQWFKKLTMKWLPIMVFILIGMWLLREPLLLILNSLN